MDLAILKRDQMTTPERRPPLQASAPAGGRSPRAHDLAYNRPTCKADLQGTRVSSLNPSSYMAENLPLGYCGFKSGVSSTSNIT
ncbi:hypothetical protein AVEN_155710-1 [Araneus ventricosus]|uniref:Uncharacterized protein n=1 Tax=Araneus ventricosus TaxID=182803 RepID=A0A4Y2HWW0_ARAVE|nr:hypothetical protein AVEN_155710-1 [Araneus ventricosus]